MWTRSLTPKGSKPAYCQDAQHAPATPTGATRSAPIRSPTPWSGRMVTTFRTRSARRIRAVGSSVRSLSGHANRRIPVKSRDVVYHDLAVRRGEVKEHGHRQFEGEWGPGVRRPGVLLRLLTTGKLLRLAFADTFDGLCLFCFSCSIVAAVVSSPRSACTWAGQLRLDVAGWRRCAGADGVAGL